MILAPDPQGPIDTTNGATISCNLLKPLPGWSMTEACTLRINAEIDRLATLRLFVENHVRDHNPDPDALYDILLAITEAASNIIQHGYRGKQGWIELEIQIRNSDMAIILRDEAPDFDLSVVPQPDLHLPLHKRPLGGLGVFLINTSMDEVQSRHLPQGGNELFLLKRDFLRHSQGDVSS
jgi:serine/threonine-protein kinase RsbW